MTLQKDYTHLAKQIIQYVGGEENIKKVIHCVTRLRFYLKDEAKAQDETIENLDGVMGVISAGGQYQVVIGPAVDDVYAAVSSELSLSEEQETAENGDEQAQTTEDLSAWGKVKRGANQLLGVITGSMMPIISILAASGIMKSLLALLTGSDLITDTGNFYLIVNAMADAVFYFLPVLIGFNAANRLGGNPVLTAVIGGAIMYPAILDAADQGMNILSIGTFDFPFVSYTYSIFPMILAAWLVKKIEAWLKTWVPSFLQAVVNPIIVIGLVTSVTFLVTGPIITWLSFGLANGLQTLLNWNAPIFGAVIDGFYQLLVIFGLHWGIIPIYVNDFATLGYSYLSAIVSVTIVGQAGAALAVAVKSKKPKVKELGYAATISAFCGITEPAIYGITLRYRRPFICASIGSAVGGFLTGLFHVNMWSIIGSIIGLPSYIDPENGITSNFWYALLITGITLLVAFLLTYFWGYNDQMEMSAKREKPKNPAKMKQA
ncbi:PTS transporter subunit EIIC [Pisciglobus halotolerans]|uniref:PTS system IIA component, Glc family /PTS system IIB component, Glc family /PTS system IIC component, Glc family n=1 Tax=Pisciglobus halotolerans TaxID=745365 RepID=A0A1I3BR09_9LACT|nr:PTS transporter subunit EIIC [Pisciglobus halotolerans]SFH64349.1 PTS system IIA component, Glc family /PTS system IIB component, Glc family /PTS system IIC component, Glc family [Pisciglobus halotolerans]